MLRGASQQPPSPERGAINFPGCEISSLRQPPKRRLDDGDIAHAGRRIVAAIPSQGREKPKLELRQVPEECHLPLSSLPLLDLAGADTPPAVAMPKWLPLDIITAGEEDCQISNSQGAPPVSNSQGSGNSGGGGGSSSQPLSQPALSTQEVLEEMSKVLNSSPPSQPK